MAVAKPVRAVAVFVLLVVFLITLTSWSRPGVGSVNRKPLPGDVHEGADATDPQLDRESTPAFSHVARGLTM